MEITDSNRLLKKCSRMQRGSNLSRFDFCKRTKYSTRTTFAYVKRRHVRLLRFKAATKTHFTILDPLTVFVSSKKTIKSYYQIYCNSEEVFGRPKEPLRMGLF